MPTESQGLSSSPAPMAIKLLSASITGHHISLIITISYKLFLCEKFMNKLVGLAITTAKIDWVSFFIYI